MNAGDWQKVKEIFDSAVDLSISERDKFIFDACDGDESLRHRVEELLSSYDTDFLEAAPQGLDAESARFLPGDRFGRYDVVKLLGVGGMGEVYLAHDAALNRKSAIKVFSSERVDGHLERFIREARSASALNHPNICTIYEINCEHEPPYIAMEFIEGETLADAIGSGRLGLNEKIDIALQAAEGLAEAHEAGVVHRDIKPANIIINKRGRVKIVDFGLAKTVWSASDDDLTQQQLTRSGMIIGTVSYMSPEQVKGEKIDTRSDIFSFGVLLYELLTFRRPFSGGSMAETIAQTLTADPPPVNSDIPRKLEQITYKCLEKDPVNRYRSMRDLIEELKLVNFEPAAGPPPEEPTVRIKSEPTSANPSGKWYTTAGFRTLGFLAAAGVVIGGVAYSFFVQNTNAPANSVFAPSRSGAYDLYVRGRVKVLSHNRDEVEGAIKLLEQAVATDPNYAEAYAALAQAYNTKAFFQSTSESERKQITENADVAVEKALALNPSLAEGHFARGLVLWTHAKRFPHDLAIQSFRRAIVLNPNIDEAHHWLGVVYYHVGLLDRGKEEIRKSLELNPNNTMARFRIGTILAYQGKYEDAIAAYKTLTRDASPWVVDRAMADALVHVGRHEEANALVEDFLRTYPMDEGGNVTSVKAILLAKAGRKKDAEAAIQRSVELGRGFGHFHHSAYNIASAYAIMNKPDDTMKWLQATVDDGFPCYPYFAIDPNLDKIRRDPRFIKFMEKGREKMEVFRTQID